MTDQEIIAAFRKLADKYGKPFAARIEQLFRCETGHFKSGCFLVALCPGMEATTADLPYGWTSLEPFWNANPSYAPTGIHIQIENTSKLAEASKKPKHFIIFPSMEASVMSVGEKIHLAGGDAGTWFGLTPEAKAAYNLELDTIIPRFVNAFN